MLSMQGFSIIYENMYKSDSVTTVARSKRNSNQIPPQIMLPVSKRWKDTSDSIILYIHYRWDSHGWNDFDHISLEVNSIKANFQLNNNLHTITKKNR